MNPLDLEEIDTEGKDSLGKGGFSKVIKWDDDNIVKILSQERENIVS